MKLEQEVKNFNKKWIELLINDNENKKIKFNNILNNSKNDMFAIMKFRRLEIEKGRGQNITADDLKFAYNDDNKLHTLLQKLFLEYIPEGYIKFIKDKINKNDIDKIYDKHFKTKNIRILNIILTL